MFSSWSSGLLGGLMIYSLVLSSVQNNPMIMCILIALSAFLMGCGLGASFSMWYFYSISLLFLGGMMVMLLYVCSLSPSVKMYISHTLPPFVMLILFTICGKLTSAEMSSSVVMVKFIYSFWNVSSLGLLGTYLVISLLWVVEVVESYKGSIKENI